MFGEKVRALHELAALYAAGKSATVLAHLYLDDFSEVVCETLSLFEPVISIALRVKLAVVLHGTEYDERQLPLSVLNYIHWLRRKHQSRFINLNSIGPHFHMYCLFLKEHGLGYIRACDAIPVDAFKLESKNGPLAAALLNAQTVTSVARPLIDLVPTVECFEIMRTVMCWQCNRITSVKKCLCEKVSYCSDACMAADQSHHRYGCFLNKTKEDYEIQIQKLRMTENPTQAGVAKTLGLLLYEGQKFLRVV